MAVTIDREWKSDTYYEKDFYVYPPTRRNRYYKCVQAGYSHSSTSGESGSFEPTWIINKPVYDHRIKWVFVPYVVGAIEWEKDTIYSVGDSVIPTTGPVEWNSNLYMYKVSSIKAEPDWKYRNNERVVDGEVIWETNISAQQFLPKDLGKVDNTYKQFYEILDYFLDDQEKHFYDISEKHRDKTKLSVDALKAIVSEYGYDYIDDVMDLSQDALSALTGYLNAIHFLKGTKDGLELVLKFLTISYDIEEWWEKNPKGEPDTYSLYVDVSMSGIKIGTLKALLAFLEHYVYPKLTEFELSYFAELAKLGFVGGGFADILIYFETMIAVIGTTGAGFHDQLFYSYVTAEPPSLRTQDDNDVITQNSDLIYASFEPLVNINELIIQAGNRVRTHNDEHRRTQKQY